MLIAQWECVGWNNAWTELFWVKNKHKCVIYGQSRKKQSACKTLDATVTILGSFHYSTVNIWCLCFHLFYWKFRLKMQKISWTIFKTCELRNDCVTCGDIISVITSDYTATTSRLFVGTNTPDRRWKKLRVTARDGRTQRRRGAFVLRSLRGLRSTLEAPLLGKREKCPVGAVQWNKQDSLHASTSC